MVSSEHLPALGKVIDLPGISHWATSRPAMRRLRTAFSKRVSHPMCTVATAPGSLSGLQQQFSDDLAAFEQRLGAAGFGERQAVVDQRADAAGG